MTQGNLFFRLVLGILLLAGTARAQSWQWATKLPDYGPPIIAKVTQLFADPNGGTVVVGEYTGQLTLGGFTLPWSGPNQPFVGRLNQAGQWTSLVKLPYLNIGQAALTNSGDLVLAGYYYAANLTIGPFAFTNPNPPVVTTTYSFRLPKSVFCRINPAGVCTQAISTGGPSADYLSRLQLDPLTGEAVVLGSFGGGAIQLGATTLGTATGAAANGLFVARLSAAGVWMQAVPCGLGEQSDPVDLALASNGEVIVGATCRGNTMTFGNYVVSGISPNVVGTAIAHLSPAGIWTQATGIFATLKSLAVTPDGTTIMNGNGDVGALFNNPALGGLSTFVARLGPAGTWTSVATLPTTTVVAPTMYVATDGSVMLAGAYWASSLQLGTYTLSSGSPSYPSGFIARLTPAGAWNWAAPVGHGGDVGEVCFTGNGMVVSGFFGGGYAPSFMQIGTTMLTTTDGSSYLARFAGVPLTTRPATPEASFTLAPNPATTQVRLVWPASGAAPRTVQLLDLLGREVRRQQVPAHSSSAELEVAGLPAGSYLVRCGAATSRLQVE